MTQQVNSLEELMHLVKSDPQFKAEFVNDPKATLTKVGLPIEENLEVSVVEEQDHNLCLVIPTADAAEEVANEGDVIAQLLARAATDANLRAEMLADPRGVIARETGLTIPAETNVTVLEQTADRAYFVIPRATAEVTDRELSAQELEAVAGGQFRCLPFPPRTWAFPCDLKTRIRIFCRVIPF
ncbi:MAG: NHLP leader peptide family RiPP precursor [Pseudanabaenaceae cyanobacterium SKYGB_i_bin29]|nr:NHLP leader peptide family RiPP precursor [Pseudanabaenaceae cyanobacterium SKYG29]MDW8421852.1 NHLP leader peptide family RiPP precursor [Pseudanabaenaceae cyanobacterium SKYGB_i_bin29]